MYTLFKFLLSKMQSVHIISNNEKSAVALIIDMQQKELNIVNIVAADKSNIIKFR